MVSIGLYPLLTLVLEWFYVANRDSLIADLFPFDTFRVYQEAFYKESILSFFLLHLLIVVLSLLPDFTIIVVNYITDAFQLFRYEYVDTIDFNMRFGDNIEKKPSPEKNCKLQRFQMSNMSQNGSSGNLGAVRINNQSDSNLVDKNILINTITNANESIVPETQTSYDNPSYETWNKKNKMNNKENKNYLFKNTLIEQRG